MQASSSQRFHNTTISIIISALLISVGPVADSRAGSNDWPGFRGPDVTGISREAGVFPSSNQFKLETTWKKPLGSGYSGVAVADGRAITAFSDGKSDVLIAFDSKTGDELWRFELAPTYEGHDGSHDGPISTPLIAGKTVFMLAPRGQFFALDAATGKLAWSSDLVKDHGAIKPHYGFTTSPLVMDGVLILQIGAKERAVAGFDPSTGSRLWSAGEDAIQYQSPIPWTFEGQRHLMAAADANLFGIKPATGEILWRFEHGGGGPQGSASATPVPLGGNLLFLASKDDSSIAFRLDRENGNVAGQNAWDERTLRSSYTVPVYHDGHIFGYSSRTLSCVDAKTGERIWRSREPGDGFTMLVDNRLVVITKHGALHVALASPDGYRELAALTVFDKDLAWSPPSFADGSFFVRSLGEIARVDIASGTSLAKNKTPGGQPAPASQFAKFLGQVQSASDKKAVIDRFMADTKQFPILEGNEWVHFVYRGPDRDVVLAGDIFGARQEQPMNRVNDTDLFYYSMKLEPDARSNYVFVCDYEQILDPFNERKTSTTLLGENMELSFTGQPMEMSWFAMPQWKSPPHLADPDPARMGRLETRELDSKITETKHKIDVYLPNGYDDGEQRYPVAYVFGGTPAREQGQFERSLDNLIGDRVAPLIAVFIDAAPWGRNQQHVEMFATELLPFIDGNFRTIDSPDARACLGHGFAGTDPFLCAFKYPNLVGKVAGQSPFIFDSNKADVIASLEEMSDNKPGVYLDWGKYDLRSPDEDWDMGEMTREFAETLEKNGCKVVTVEANDGTGFSSWRNRNDKLFVTLFPE